VTTGPIPFLNSDIDCAATLQYYHSIVKKMNPVGPGRLWTINLHFEPDLIFLTLHQMNMC